MIRRRRRTRPDIDGSVLRWPGAQQRFALFGEVLWVGMLMAVVCVGVVTWPAAMAAGAAHLRRYLRGEATPVGAFFGDVRSALRGGVVVGAVSTALTAIAVVDVLLASTGRIPGGAFAAGVVVLLAVVGSVVVIAAACEWMPGASWRALLRAAPAALRADLSGTVYIAVALVLGGVVAWQFLPLAIPALGLVVFAVVAVGERRRARQQVPA